MFIIPISLPMSWNCLQMIIFSLLMTITYKEFISHRALQLVVLSGLGTEALGSKLWVEFGSLIVNSQIFSEVKKTIQAHKCF